MHQVRQRRFYCCPIRSGSVELDAGQAHHAAGVLRLEPGDPVELFDGAGTVADGEIRSLSRRSAIIEICGAVRRLERPRPTVRLAFAVPKGKRLDWLLEKATELGAACLQPVVFGRSVAAPAEPGSGKWDRWQGHCIAAAKQSGLNFLPELPAGLELEAFLATRPEDSIGILGQVGLATDPLAEVLPQSLPGQLDRLIGPDGGLTQGESTVATRAGFRPARIGRTVLRVETAAVAMLAGVMSRLG